MRTAWDLAQLPPVWLRDRFGVVLERTARELAGMSCLVLEQMAPARQQIMVSRGFGAVQTELAPVRAALAAHCSRASEKLRRQDSEARLLTVFLHTNPFAVDEPQYHASRIVPLPTLTADVRVLVRAAESGLRQLWHEGYRYKKVGVILAELGPAGTGQTDMLLQVERQRGAELMATVDRVNGRFGRHALQVASAARAPGWQARAERCSPRYTTCWEEIPQVRAI